MKPRPPLSPRPFFALLPLLVALAVLAALPRPVRAQAPSAAPSAKVDRPFVFNLGAEPPTIDPGKSTTVGASVVERNVFEGLTRPMPDGTIEPAAAESWTISDDGLEYTFHLREGLRWSNGEPLTAGDFVYSWLRVLEPAFAAEYAYSLYMIAGAEAYNQGTGTAADVGVEALDDRTIRMRLAAPAPYLLGFVDHSTFLPVYPPNAKASDKWSLSPGTFVSNGPYKITEISPKERLVLEVNEFHRDAPKVGLRKLIFREIEDSSTALIEFRNGRIDAILDSPPLADLQTLRDEGLLKNIANLGTYFVCFNTQQPPFDNREVRKAFTLAIDRGRLTRLLRTGDSPAMAFVPPGIAGADGVDYRAKYGEFFKDHDVMGAQEALKAAGLPGGIPPVVYIYNTHDRHKQVAEYMQNVWKRELKVDVRVQNMEWKVLTDARTTGNYQMARHGWIGDFADPLTFLDMWLSTSGNNDAKWRNADYDRLIAAARGAVDPARRFDLFAQAEKLLIDDFAICPLFYYTQNYVETDEVEGIERSVTMTTRFDRAHWK